jgi:hypothetical protein
MGRTLDRLKGDVEVTAPAPMAVMWVCAVVSEVLPVG